MGDEQDKSAVVVDRWTSAVASSEEHVDENSSGVYRPLRFDDYPGQDRVVSNLKVYVDAAKISGRPLDHVLLHGPPGLGKTTLARIVAAELGAPFQHTSGPAVDKPGDLAGMLLGLEPRTVLFIDEIHRLSVALEEYLYSAMEDFVMDFVTGQGPTARSRRVPIAPFTLIGATTRVASLSRPLIARFGIQERLDFYDEGSLTQILMNAAPQLSMSVAPEGAAEIARRSRGTPRIALRLMRRIRDFAVVAGAAVVDRNLAHETLLRLEVDEKGLDAMDRNILRSIAERYDGGPVGVETLAATIGEERTTIEDVYEPFLVHMGFITRTPRGRCLTKLAFDHIGCCARRGDDIFQRPESSKS